ncbi:MAG: mechanosensitive ion channel [Flavobacteriales bacterium]|nr:MAG: mechanosensitive ion channel [Flavobacteriales bacterium]
MFKLVLKYIFLLFLGFSSLSLNAQQPDSVQTIPDTLLFRIQQAQVVISEVNATNKKGYNLNSLSKSLQEIRQSIASLEQDFKKSGNTVDTKNLLNYELILKDASQRLAELRKVLVKQSNQLQDMSDQVVSLSADSVLSVTKVKDETKTLYKQQLLQIRNRLQETGKTTGENLDKVGRLLADVSAVDLIVNDLRTQTTERLQQSGKMALGREAPYIWNARWVSGQDISSQLFASYLGQKEIISYFISSTWDTRVVIILIALLFFFWVHRNLKLSRRPAIKRKVGELKFDYLNRFPLLATIIVALSIVPLFEQGAPSLYIELVTLLLLAAISFHLQKALTANQFKGWLVLVFAYALLIFFSSINGTGLLLRIPLLILNIFFVYLAVKMFPKLRLVQFSKKYVKAVLILFISLNALAVLLNIFGRLSLAKAFALTGVVGLVQLIALAVFVQVILDALELQLKISACSKGFFSRVSHAGTRITVKNIMQLLALVLWGTVFLTNMNLTSGTVSFFETVLSKPRGFGNINFTLGNILFFVLVIYATSKLQKYVPVFFGEGNLSYEGQVEQKSSKVALVRLIIIVLGVLLGLAASGLPMDRLTVVLGALGVGIGLGMQNIVNNFVSGIILIFERPFRIGDFVELADKKGRVKDIGIRSSKLVTQQGSEVIIPNGDLLSGRLVNWTLSHDYVKTELLFKVPAETDLAQLKKMVENQVAKTEHAMSKLPVEVLVNNIAAGTIELKIMAWVESIYTEPNFKSELMGGLLQEMNKAGIKVA